MARSCGSGPGRLMIRRSAISNESSRFRETSLAGALFHFFPPWTTASFLSIGGRSGGGRLVASKSVKRALHFGSYWSGGRSHGSDFLGQPRAILSIRSHRRMLTAGRHRQGHTTRGAVLTARLGKTVGAVAAEACSDDPHTADDPTGARSFGWTRSKVSNPC